MEDYGTAGPPPMERMQKVGELYEDPETGFAWLVYTTPLMGEVVMEARLLDEAEIEEAVETDEQGRTVYYVPEHPDGVRSVWWTDFR
jgi:hypothetical protein